MAFRTGLVDRRIPQRIIAFGIFRTGIKNLAASGFSLQKLAFFTLWTVDAGIRRLFQRFDIAALRVGAAADEFAVAALFDHQGGPALGTSAALHLVEIFPTSSLHNIIDTNVFFYNNVDTMASNCVEFAERLGNFSKDK